MSTITIRSLESLDSAAGDLTRTKIALALARGECEAQQADVSKRYEPRIQFLADQCAALESAIAEYTDAHREEVLGPKKSRETPLATWGFRLGTRVEPANRRIKWGEIVERLARLAWGAFFLRFKEPTVNKQALLDARDTLTPEQLTKAGIRFVTEDSFFFEPKSETAQE